MPRLKPQKAPSLTRLDLTQAPSFISPAKLINTGTDVSQFLTSHAYTDIMTFLLQLTTSMFPRNLADSSVQIWELGSDAVEFSADILAVRAVLKELDGMVEKFPPDTNKETRRFGNVAFRGWCEGVEERVDVLLERHLPSLVKETGSGSEASAMTELKAYFMGSWGSAQRLDYGTGHELSFLAFLGCLWKLGAFQSEGRSDGEEERGIVLGIIDPYLALIRRLILTYTLEPAGSHGVWGLDDHSFLPYIFGSAQLSPAISNTLHIPTEGSLPDTPSPNDITKPTVVERERQRNMYFGAIGFIYDVKKGPFWEHSPVLYDISGVEKGWAKINKGMIKMYNAEVLSKFPVVQHFPFGSLFRWETDPEAVPPTTTPHVESHAQGRASAQHPPNGLTAAPWAGAANGLSISQNGATTRPTPTGAPWAASVTSMSNTARPAPASNSMGPPTRAPWAK